MGVDLDLIPIEEEYEDAYCSTLVFNVARGDDFYSLFLSLDTTPLPVKLVAPMIDLPGNLSEALKEQTFFYEGWSDENVMGLIERNPYGKPLDFSSVSDIKTASASIDRVSSQNKPILAYINELSDNTKIVLYWT